MNLNPNWLTFTVIGIFALLLLSSPTHAAAVPSWLMSDATQVGAVFRYGEGQWRVEGVRGAKDSREYRVRPWPDHGNEWRGWWISHRDMVLTLKDPKGHTWKSRKDE